jgi:hypothetical protein
VEPNVLPGAKDNWLYWRGGYFKEVQGKAWGILSIILELILSEWL